MAGLEMMHADQGAMSFTLQQLVCRNFDLKFPRKKEIWPYSQPLEIIAYQPYVSF